MSSESGEPLRNRPSDGALGPVSRSSRLLNRRTTFALDLLVLVAAFGLVYLLRFDFAVRSGYRHLAISQLPLVLAVQFVALYMSGALAFVWRYVGMAEVPAFVRAGVGSALFLLALRLLVPGTVVELRVPLSIIIMNALTAFGGLLAIRVARRAFSERNLSRSRAVRHGGHRPPVLLFGAGAAGVMAVREIRSRGEQEMDLRGFVDDDPTKQRAVISGLKVLGPTEALPKLVAALGIHQVIITIADAHQAQLRRILSLASRSGCGRR